MNRVSSRLLSIYNQVYLLTVQVPPSQDADSSKPEHWCRQEREKGWNGVIHHGELATVGGGRLGGGNLFLSELTLCKETTPDISTIGSAGRPVHKVIELSFRAN